MVFVIPDFTLKYEDVFPSPAAVMPVLPGLQTAGVREA